MRILVVLALVTLAASFIRANSTEEPSSGEVTTNPPSENTAPKCSEACALKTLFFDGYNFAKDFAKLLVRDSSGDQVDAAFEACNGQEDDSDDDCDVYFRCIETEFDNRNITLLFSDFFN